MRIDLSRLSPQRFEELCQALLRDELPRFQVYSAPDSGMDGYDSDSATVFQVYFPEQSPIRSKIVRDLDKALLESAKNPGAVKRWVLLIPKDPSRPLSDWLGQSQQTRCPFQIEIQGKTLILQMLRRNPRVSEQSFPSDIRKEVNRLARGKTPKAGDALPGHEISDDQREELRALLIEVAEEEASRKHRKVDGRAMSAAYGEFNAHFDISTFDRLPADKIGEARGHLERKRHARRRGESKHWQRKRDIGGIKAILNELKMSDSAYRALLVESTGKSSLGDLDAAEVRRVFQHFRRLQGLAMSAPDV